MTKMNLF